MADGLQIGKDENGYVVIVNLDSDNHDAVAMLPLSDDEDYDNNYVRDLAKNFAAAPDMYGALVEAFEAGYFECNCGDACDGSCTYSRMVRALVKAGYVVPPALKPKPKLDPNVDESGRNCDRAQMVIPARFRTDDGQYTFDFEAVGWFVRADEVGLKEVIACGYGNDTPADAIAYDLESHNWRIKLGLEHCSNLKDDPTMSDRSGFEVEVDELAAKRWLQENRPELVSDDGT